MAGVFLGFGICDPLTTLLIFFQKYDTPWFAIFTSPAVWGIIVAHFCNNWGFYTFLTCLPSYFKEVLNFSISQVRKTHCYRSLVERKKRAIPHLFERLFLISWENNRDCHITMSLSLKTVEMQIKGDQ